jgi:hypothetical protein
MKKYFSTNIWAEIHKHTKTLRKEPLQEAAVAPASSGRARGGLAMPDRQSRMINRYPKISHRFKTLRPARS